MLLLMMLLLLCVSCSLPQLQMLLYPLSPGSTGADQLRVTAAIAGAQTQLFVPPQLSSLRSAD